MWSWVQKNAEWTGWLAIWVYIAVFVSASALRIVLVGSQKELPEHYIAPVEMAVYFLLFAVFLRGVRAFAIRSADAELIKTWNSIIAVSVLEMIIVYPYNFGRYLESNFLTLLFVAIVPLLCVHGILLLRLAENFSKHVANLGTIGKRIVLWNKVAGWMLASVVLVIPGVIVSLIAEFFLWRLLARSHKDGATRS